MGETDRQSKMQNICPGIDVARDFMHEIKRELCEVHEVETWGQLRCAARVFKLINYLSQLPHGSARQVQLLFA